MAGALDREPRDEFIERTMLGLGVQAAPRNPSQEPHRAGGVVVGSSRFVSASRVARESSAHMSRRNAAARLPPGLDADALVQAADRAADRGTLAHA